ncbi:MAG: hypothetical protein V5A62_06080 [Haloarculaceae archaeon]
METSAEELRHDTLDGLAHVPFDAALDALGHVRRRELLYALLDRDERDGLPVVPADSTDGIDTPERLVAVDDAHLPKLAAYGFVDWNRETDEVTRGAEFDGIVPLLELLSEHEGELPDGKLSFPDG